MTTSPTLPAITPHAIIPPCEGEIACDILLTAVIDHYISKDYMSDAMHFAVSLVTSAFEQGYGFLFAHGILKYVVISEELHMEDEAIRKAVQA